MITNQITESIKIKKNLFIEIEKDIKHFRS